MNHLIGKPQRQSFMTFYDMLGFSPNANASTLRFYNSISSVLKMRVISDLRILYYFYWVVLWKQESYNLISTANNFVVGQIFLGLQST